jgi:hypothetical protein
MKRSGLALAALVLALAAAAARGQEPKPDALHGLAWLAGDW